MRHWNSWRREYAMSERTVLEAAAGESITQFTARLVDARPSRGTFNGVELDVPIGTEGRLLVDALAMIYALKARIREFEKRGGW
jgi:hypothetical protein